MKQAVRFMTASLRYKSRNDLVVQSKSSAGCLIPSGTHSQTLRRVSQITGRKGGFSLPVLLFVDVSFIFWEASRLGPSPPTAGMHAAPAQEDIIFS